MEPLADRRKELQDAPLPGANPVAALVLERLAVLTGEEGYRGKARETLEAFAGSAARLGTFAATYGRAVDFHLSPPVRVVVVGDREEAGTQALWRQALASYRPHKSVLLHEPGGKPALPLPAGLTAEIGEPPAGGPPRSFVCVGGECAGPTSDPARQAELIRTLGRERQSGRQKAC